MIPKENSLFAQNYVCTDKANYHFSNTKCLKLF